MTIKKDLLSGHGWQTHYLPINNNNSLWLRPLMVAVQFKWTQSAELRLDLSVQLLAGPRKCFNVLMAAVFCINDN